MSDGAEASAAYQCARADSRVPRQALRRYARRLDGAALDDCVDYARKRVFKVLAYVHLDHCVRFVVCEWLCIVQELPDDALVRFSMLAPVQRLVLHAALGCGLRRSGGSPREEDRATN